MTTRSAIKEVNLDIVENFPRDWSIVSISQISENHDNKRKPIKSTDREKMRGEYPYCGANGVVDYINTYKLDGEYVLVAEDGGYWGKGEETAYIMDGKFFVNNHAHILKAIEGKTTNYFLQLMLNYLNIDPLIGGDARGKLTKSVLSNLPFPLPQLSEQEAITRVLKTVQDAITEQENLISKLKAMKRSMMQHLFTHGTKGKKTKMTEIGEIPESWETAELIDVCDKPQYGFTDSASSKGNVRFLRITDITDQGVNWDTVPFCNCAQPEKYLLQDSDIVFARIGATTGKSFLLRNPDNAVYASYLIRVRAKTIDSSFLYHYFQTEAYWRQIDSQKGMNLKGGVNGSILSKLIVPKCDGTEQRRIAESLSAIDARVESTRVKLASYQSLFKTLLHDLMSGESRVVNI